MAQSPQIDQRKSDHIRIIMEKPVEPLPSPFARYRLPYRALPELDLAEIETETTFLGKSLAFPFLISSMTGGPDKTRLINRRLAQAAERAGVALALGSMRFALEEPESWASFEVRELCPSVPLLANIGLVQLNYGVGADELNLLVDRIRADGLFLHVNPLQEAVQPEGDTNFKDLIPKLAEMVRRVEVPILVKEVGTGIDLETARALAGIGIRWLDVAGSGGTSWAWVEGYRRPDRLGHLFKEVGIPTDIALQQAATIEDLNLIGGGGIRSGMDMAKALMMGAHLASAAKPLLEPALQGVDSLSAVLASFRRELVTAMFCVGARTLGQLREIRLLVD